MHKSQLLSEMHDLLLFTADDGEGLFECLLLFVEVDFYLSKILLILFLLVV